MLLRAVIAIWLLAGWGVPAAAASGISIPEPSDPSLFALGVVGLLVGRWVAKRRPRN